MQILINGTIQGLLIALLAMGFSIVYNSTGIIYVAQGTVYAISPFLILSFLKFGIGIPFAVFFTFVITILLSMSLEKINHWPLYKKEASPLIQLISSLGIHIIIVGGTGNFRGPIVGAFTLIAIPEILRFLYIPDAIAANIRLLIYGLLIVTMVYLRPQGLAGKYRFK